MHHPALQSDFQPPYFPPPFHHTTQSPPQQQNHGTHGIEYLGAADPYGHVVSELFQIRLITWSLNKFQTVEIAFHKQHSEISVYSFQLQKYQHYNQLTGLRPTQEQLGIHRTHREAELQGHVVSKNKKVLITFYFLQRVFM